MKLTAQFVARNGRNFMDLLNEREKRNYQFDFLRNNHSLFGYFSKLVEQYTKILVPTPVMLEQINARSKDKYAVQEIVMKRVEYTAYQQELRKKRNEKEDAERRKFTRSADRYRCFNIENGSAHRQLLSSLRL
jgi:splicing factor 3A subunit 1